MSLQRVLVYGAGGHGKVVVDILERMDQYQIVGFVDDDPSRKGCSFFGYPTIGALDALLEYGPQTHLILAIGDNEARGRLAHRLEPLGFQFVTAVHPTASLGRDAKLGWGTVIMANVAINSGATIGRHVIINTGATIDHDCVIGDYVHISPGVHLGGHVTVGALSHVGIGASIADEAKVGENSIIGAGAAVVQDIPPNVVAVGVPCRVIKVRG